MTEDLIEFLKRYKVLRATKVKQNLFLSKMVSDATNLHIWNTLFELSDVDFSEIPSPHYTIVKGKLFLMSVTDSFQRWSWYWLLLNSWEKLSVASLLSRGTRARACPAYKCPQKPKMCSPRAKKAQSGAKKSLRAATERWTRQARWRRRSQQYADWVVQLSCLRCLFRLIGIQ